VAKNTGSQYDDDLTVGLDDLDNESIDTDYVDLFEYTGDEESPIARLKTIMLSIEWEITDEVLINFNDELVQAREAWSNDRVKLVYVQALQIISKYIYQKKSDAHPNAMKVLLAFFYDLEKIALDTELSEQERKQILNQDIRKFERFKQQIGLAPRPGAPPRPAAEETLSAELEGPEDSTGDDGELYRLKASILTIDWEITDRELADISREIAKLQRLYASSKPRMILLQGLDALGGYIKLKKSEAHAGAFRLLNSLYDALELFVGGGLSPEEEKTLLLAEASKFNQFKQKIAASITPEAIAEQRRRTSAGDSAAEAPGDPVSGGFDSEVSTASAAVDAGLQEGDFSEETLEKVSSFFGEFEEEQPISLASLPAEEALRGVEVETEADDDSDEDALPTLEDGMLAPALAELGDGQEEPSPGPVEAPAQVQGVDVESEVDEDFEEIPLPTSDGEIAPALFSSDEPEAIDALGSATEPTDDSADIDKHVEDFFGEPISDFEAASTETDEEPAAMAAHTDTELPPALSGVWEESEQDVLEYDSRTETELGEQSFDAEVADRIDSFFDEDVEKPIMGAELPETEGLERLRASIESFDYEANDSTIGAMQAEIDSLKNRWQDRPLEKTLLQLIATASQHVGKGYGSDDETVTLMRSICNILDQVSCQKVDQTKAQELLFSETSKVLDWQKNLIDRQVTGKKPS
jgi:pilus assembly protein FimV